MKIESSQIEALTIKEKIRLVQRTIVTFGERKLKLLV